MKKIISLLFVLISTTFLLGYENITFVFAASSEDEAYQELEKEVESITGDFDFSALDDYVKSLSADENLFFSGTS